MVVLQLVTLMNGASDLQKLRVLQLMRSGLNQLPASVAESLPSLEYLDLNKNYFTRLPGTLSVLTNLRTLNMANNKVHLDQTVLHTLAPLSKLHYVSLAQYDREVVMLWSCASSAVLVSIVKTFPNLHLDFLGKNRPVPL